MSKQRTHLLILATAGALLLGGCAEFPGFGQKQAHSPAHPKAVAVKTAPQKAAAAPAREASPSRDRDDSPKEASGLREGIRMYNDGDFDGAIRRLSARDVNNGPLG